MQGNICLFGAVLQAAWPNRSKKEYPENSISPSADGHGKFLFVMDRLSPLYITWSCVIHQASLETCLKKALWSWAKAIISMPYIHVRTGILFSITTLTHPGMTVLVLQGCTKHFREATLSYFSKKIIQNIPLQSQNFPVFPFKISTSIWKQEKINPFGFRLSQLILLQTGTQAALLSCVSKAAQQHKTLPC